MWKVGEIQHCLAGVIREVSHSLTGSVIQILSPLIERIALYEFYKDRPAILTDMDIRFSLGFSGGSKLYI